MNENTPRPEANRSDNRTTATWLWVFAAVFAVILLVALLLPKTATRDRNSKIFSGDASRAGSAGFAHSQSRSGSAGRWRGEATATAEEIVARKLTQFAKSRRELVLALAKHHKVEVPDDVKRFFDAVEGGRWEEIDAA